MTSEFKMTALAVFAGLTLVAFGVFGEAGQHASLIITGGMTIVGTATGVYTLGRSVVKAKKGPS